MTKRCLVICPFGKEGTDERKLSDTIFDNLLKRAVEPKGYHIFRSIDNAQPGDFSNRIIKDIYEVDLLIADLTGGNANVFYELALRISIAKPFILISDKIEGIPIDVSLFEVITIGDALQGNLESVSKVQDQLQQQIDKIDRNEVDFETPAWSLRPENSEIDGPHVVTREYTWRLNYSNRLAADWLSLQDERLAQFVNEFLHDESIIPRNDQYRKALGEYLAYKMAQGQPVVGRLYYTVKKQTGQFEGSGILDMGKGSELVIKVNGNEIGTDLIKMSFIQPRQSIPIGEKIEVELKGYRYNIDFHKNPITMDFEGTLLHPDYGQDVEGNSLLVASTELTLNF